MHRASCRGLLAEARITTHFIAEPELPLESFPSTNPMRLGYNARMKKSPTQAQKAARLLGKLGGMATLKKYGAEKMREWGKLGAEHGKKGGRPKGSGKKSTRR